MLLVHFQICTFSPGPNDGSFARVTVQRIILLHLTLSLQPIIILILQFLDMCECSETVHWSTDVWESFLRLCHPNMIIGVVLIQDWK